MPVTTWESLEVIRSARSVVRHHRRGCVQGRVLDWMASINAGWLGFADMPSIVFASECEEMRMATGAPHLAETEFLRRLQRPSLRGVFSVQTHGGEIPIQVIRRRSPVLLVIFAGAVDRQQRTLPQFGGQFLRTYVPASVVGVADPSLSRSPTLRTAWYLGHDGFELQQILPDLVRRIAAVCEAERVIFFGGSAGGFAALYYSWCLPGSIALAFNPQTDIECFLGGHKADYRASCRPALGKGDPLATVVRSSVVSCYAERFDNTVIYLQNAADSGHVRKHFAPFLAAVDVANHRSLLARLAYWGNDGHIPPPPHEWFVWLKAAMASPSSSAEDIQRTRKEYTVPKPSNPMEHFAEFQDYRLASALVDQARSRTDPTVEPPSRANIP